MLFRSKVVLIPSVREGWNLVATEAMACGSVPIAYNVPGLRDSIENNKTGILVSPTPNALTDASISLLKDERTRSKLARNGFTYSQKFSWNNTYEDFKKLIFATKNTNRSS